MLFDACMHTQMPAQSRFESGAGVAADIRTQEERVPRVGAPVFFQLGTQSEPALATAVIAAQRQGFGMGAQVSLQAAGVGKPPPAVLIMAGQMVVFLLGKEVAVPPAMGGAGF